MCSKSSDIFSSKGANAFKDPVPRAPIANESNRACGMTPSLLNFFFVRRIPICSQSKMEISDRTVTRNDNGKDFDRCRESEMPPKEELSVIER